MIAHAESELLKLTGELGWRNLSSCEEAERLATVTIDGIARPPRRRDVEKIAAELDASRREQRDLVRQTDERRKRIRKALNDLTKVLDAFEAVTKLEGNDRLTVWARTSGRAAADRFRGIIDDALERSPSWPTELQDIVNAVRSIPKIKTDRHVALVALARGFFPQTSARPSDLTIANVVKLTTNAVRKMQRDRDT